MTPIEKAAQFINKFMFADIYFTNGNQGAIKNAKACALIAVEEIIDITPMYKGDINQEYIYWTAVKSEIEKL